MGKIKRFYRKNKGYSSLWTSLGTFIILLPMMIHHPWDTLILINVPLLWLLVWRRDVTITTIRRLCEYVQYRYERRVGFRHKFFMQHKFCAKDKIIFKDKTYELASFDFETELLAYTDEDGELRWVRPEDVTYIPFKH